VTLSMFEDMVNQIIPPRTILTKFPFGAPFGDPGNIELQLKVIEECLELLKSSDKPGEVLKTQYKWLQKI